MGKHSLPKRRKHYRHDLEFFAALALVTSSALALPLLAVAASAHSHTGFKTPAPAPVRTYTPVELTSWPAIDGVPVHRETVTVTSRVLTKHRPSHQRAGNETTSGHCPDNN